MFISRTIYPSCLALLCALSGAACDKGERPVPIIFGVDIGGEPPDVFVPRDVSLPDTGPRDVATAGDGSGTAADGSGAPADARSDADTGGFDLGRCGDGVLNPFNEECDDSNDNDIDGCSNTCVLSQCGDGVLNAIPGVERLPALRVEDPFGTVGYVCDDGASCPEGSCEVLDNPFASEHGICQALGFDRAVRVEWGGGPGAGAANVVRAFAWDCASYRCESGSTLADVPCESWEMLRAIECEGVLAEECDDGTENAMIADTCRSSNCQLPRCGDGIVDTDEDCDDGNENDEDGCTNTCLLPQCGDGIVQEPEQCDDGNAINDDECRDRCVLPRCGDGILQAFQGEICDEGRGNSREPDAVCRPDCEPPRCGDGVIDTGEECDAFLGPYDVCTPACTFVECGDGIVSANEACDDGNDIDDDECRNNCTLSACGDGVLAEVEECDEGSGNSAEPDASCRPDCTVARCGDGVVDTGEECDDGNTVSRDLCLNTCMSSVCGDGFRQTVLGEQCDDGNLIAGDGCDDTCIDETGFVEGRIVYIGHDYFNSNPSTIRLLTNVLVSTVTPQPRVLGYTEYSDTNPGAEVERTSQAIFAAGAAGGLAPTLTVAATEDAALAALASHDVLVIYEQERGSRSIMTSLSQRWRDSILQFVDSGGQVVVLDHSGASYLLLEYWAASPSLSERRLTSTESVFVQSSDNAVLNGLGTSYGAASGTIGVEFARSAELVPLVLSSDGFVIVGVWAP